MFDVVGFSILVVLLVLFGALTVWAFRARRLWVRLVGGIPAGLLMLVFGAATTMAVIGYAKLNAQQPNPVRPFTVEMTAERIAIGEKYARACAGCHSPNQELPLTGQDFMPGAPFGTFYAPNLTPAELADWSDGEIIRAIREGVHKDGRSLLIMPSKAFHGMSDDDVMALVAYLRSQPADSEPTPPLALNVFGAIMFGALNDLRAVQPPIGDTISAPPAGPTAEYGMYLLQVGGCMECHGSDLNGAITPEGAQAPNLHNVGATWSEDEFIHFFRTGLKPDGQPVAESMPWQDFEKFSDDDLRALYRGLQQ